MNLEYRFTENVGSDAIEGSDLKIEEVTNIVCLGWLSIRGIPFVTSWTSPSFFGNISCIPLEKK